jgi:hypothetical protein
MITSVSGVEAANSLFLHIFEKGQGLSGRSIPLYGAGNLSTVIAGYKYTGM